MPVFFSFLFVAIKFFFSFPVMSNSARSQRRFPFRTPVRIQRNYRKLPPITQTIRPIEEDPIEQIPIKQIPIKQEIQPAKSSLSIGNIDIKCETPSVDVNDFWIQLRQHIAQERLERYDDHGNQQTPNKVVRIFVSSTFTDFFNEREVLIKKVKKNIDNKILIILCFSSNDRYSLHYVMKWNQQVFK